MSVERRPFCVRCCAFMRCAKNGAFVRYESLDGRAGDRYECPTCGSSVVVGFSADPMRLTYLSSTAEVYDVKPAALIGYVDEEAP